MRTIYATGLVVASLLLAACSSSHQLSASGKTVRFAEKKPGPECQLLGVASGEQSNWFSGQKGEVAGSMRSAANQLRNKAAEMGGNVLYNVNSPSQNLLSSLAPVATRMSGQVFKCPL